MITKQEIIDFAREFNLPVNTIEKDYVLGWLLAGIANDTELFDKWIFKGGTCLKKCYFETYRFSEDLDYTLTDINQINENFLVDHFKNIGEWIYETIGIEIIEDSIRFEIYLNKDGKTCIEGRLNYVGPLQRRNNPHRVKLDLTAEEILVLPPMLRVVHHPYSDNPPGGIKAYCYNFSEVFAEKIRALSERARPRDLYDVTHLYRHAFPGEKHKIIFEVLKKKCEYKAIPLPTMKLFVEHPKLDELESEWTNMLSHQVPMLPAKELYWQELPNLIDWLHGNNCKLIKTPIPLPVNENINSSWQPSSMIQAWGLEIPFELIRYAGANHFCIKIDYNNNTYLIEPYDLKKNQDEILILIAVNHETNELCTFHIKFIQKVIITEISFSPRYLISLTPLLK